MIKQRFETRLSPFGGVVERFEKYVCLLHFGVFFVSGLNHTRKLELAIQQVC